MNQHFLIKRTKRAMGVVLSAVLLCSFEVNAANLAEETLKKELRALRANPRDAYAEVHVIKIFNLWDMIGPTAVVDALNAVKKIKFASNRVKNRTDYLLAEADLRLGKTENAFKSFNELGFINDWIVAGPFNNEGGIGVDTQYAPETENSMGADIPMAGKNGDVFWRKMPEDISLYGYNYLESLHEPMTNTCFFARSTLVAQKSARGMLWIGVGGAFRAYWNGKEAISDNKYRYSDPDRFAAGINVQKGKNTLLVKVCTEEKGDFGFFARVTTKSSEPWVLTPAKDQLASLAVTRIAKDQPHVIAQPVQSLVTVANKKKKDARAQFHAASYLLMTSSKDLDAHQARDLAQKACEIAPSGENCLLWSSLALDRNEKRLAIANAEIAEPENIAVILARARWEMEGVSPANALKFIKKVYKQDKESLDATLLEIDVLSRRGMLQLAYERILRLSVKHTDIPRLLTLASGFAELAGRKSDALALLEKTTAFRFDDSNTHLVLARAAMARGDFDTMSIHVDALFNLSSFDSEIKLQVAEMMEGLGDVAKAEQYLRSRLDMAPKSANAWKELGQFLIRTGKREEGIESLRSAARIQPQDAWLTKYLGHVGSEGRFEQEFIIPEMVFLGWRQPAAEETISKYLVNQKVVKVYESGLSSSFHQTVFEIGNREDAKDWRTRVIQFSTSSQQVQLLAARVYHPDGTVEKVVRRGVVPISEPWYRLYYDIAAEVLAFPKLSPKDVVELQYRVDDIASRNVFNDYFGDIEFIRGIHPRHFWRYVLIAPEKRDFQFNHPRHKLHQLKEKRGTDIQYTFQAKNILAIMQEGGMPGQSEIAPYLHLSTYKSWQDLGKWYRGLVRHQMVPDQRIREQVKKLIAGKKTDKEKVEAIYNWVVTATRYVGLEFGIHGYKPYRAPLVVSRGFGDCKDKASLLVTMLTLAGVEASFVLIRTNDLGKLESEPASLAVFNHAIIYVPSLDIYLDGTAENHGIFELPFQDQDATALVLRKGGAELLTTPVVNADKNAQHVVTQVNLKNTGEADIDSRVSVTGSTAAALRQLLEAEGTRRERFEGSLAQSYPGAELKELTMESLMALSKPVSYRFSAKVPEFAQIKEDDLEIPIDEKINLIGQFARLAHRHYDLMLGPKSVHTRETTIKIPAGFQVVPIAADTKIVSKFGTLVLEAETRKDSMRISRRFEMSAHKVKSEDYSEFIEFARQVDETLSKRILIRRTR